MAFSYLEPDTLFDAMNDSLKYMRPLFEPFQEYERIARNRPFAGIDKAYPKVTDGTTASVIQKTPRRIIQQLPTGNAHSDTNDWLTHVASFIFNNRIVPNANSQYMLIQKCWNIVSKALTYGSQPAYVPFLNRGKYFGTDMQLPYIKDCFLETGKLSDEDSNFIIMRAWYQPRDIKALIANQSKLKKNAEERGDTFESGWDLEALAEIENMISQKDDLSTTANERDKNNRNGGIEILHGFQRGIGGTFYSWHQKTKKIVRTKVNKDPRGFMPVHYMYADTDGSNPLGRGFIELVGAMQNLMDSEVQMYQYNRALMLNPPVIKRGDWNKNQAKFAPNTVWDLGMNPQNVAEALKIDSTALNNFPQNYGLMKSQLMNLLASPNPDISAQTGSGMSKTSKGVQNAQNIVNVDDNYIRKQFESLYQRFAETSVNLYFAERHGIEELQLDSDTAAEIRELDPSLVDQNNRIRIDYDTETEELQFFVDTGTSELKDNEEEITKLQEVIQMVDSNPYSLQYMQQSGKDLQFGEVYRQLFEKLGLKDMDKIITDVPKDEKGQPMAPAPMAMDKPKLNIHYPDLPPAAQIQMLRNAGITVTMQDLMVGTIIDPNVRGRSDKAGGGMDSAQGQMPTAADHPIIQLMSSLNIKFPDLPEDSKQEVLKIIGIPTTMSSPTQQGLDLKSIDQQHQILSGMAPPDPLQQAQGQAQLEQTQQQTQMAQQQPPEGAVGTNTAQPIPSQVQAVQTQPAQTVPNNAGQPQQAGLAMPQTSQPTQSPGGIPMPQTPASPNEPTASPANQPVGPAPQPSDNLTADDHAFMQKLQKMGLSIPQAGQALALIHHGHSVPEVLQMIGASNGR